MSELKVRLVVVSEGVGTRIFGRGSGGSGEHVCVSVFRFKEDDLLSTVHTVHSPPLPTMTGGGGDTRAKQPPSH